MISQSQSIAHVSTIEMDYIMSKSDTIRKVEGGKCEYDEYPLHYTAVYIQSMVILQSVI